MTGFAYSNGGLTFRAWDQPGNLASGEVYFAAPPTPTQLAAAFPGYTAAAALLQAGNAYNQWIGRGLTVTCTSVPAIDGTYAINAGSQHTIALEAQFISAFSEFTTGSTTNLPWQLANGQFVVFPTTALFLAFSKAAGMAVAAAKLATAQGAALPSNSVAIP